MIFKSLILVFIILWNAAAYDPTSFLIEVCIQHPGNPLCKDFQKTNKKLLSKIGSLVQCDSNSFECHSDSKLVAQAVTNLKLSFNSKKIKKNKFPTYLSQSLLYCSLNSEKEICHNIFGQIDYNEITKDLINL